MSAPRLELDDVRWSRSRREILRGVTLAVPAGAVTCLRGASGSGKSTVLRLCNRLEVPDSGVVRCDGADVAGWAATDLRRRVGMAFQQPVPFAGTVRDNLRVAAPDAGDDALADALERVALPASMLGAEADRLSGGEAQRMCLARALLTGPAVLLLDEPTSALDEASRDAVEAAVAAFVARDDRAALWVTHDAAQAGRVGDRSVWLRDGRVHDRGPA